MPAEQPDYMPQEFIDYLASRFEIHGFGPPLNWYRNFPRTFERLQGVDDTIHVPAMFLTSRGDWTWQFTQMAGIDDTALFSDLRLRDEIDGSHWLGQEHPDWANTRIAEFLALIGY
jgi:pimeloyl-ACP methyl ester carboxylesterase